MRELMDLTWWTLWESHYESWYKWWDEFDWNWSESMRIEWTEWIEVKWGEMSDLMEVSENNPMGKSYGFDERYPMRMDRVEWSDPNPIRLIKLMRIDEKWMKWGRISESKWNEWFDGSEREQPYENVLWVGWEVHYENRWIRLKLMRIDEKWMNWSEMSEMR